MIKRYVVLQDEQLVVREIERNIQRASLPLAVPAGRTVVPGVGPYVPPPACPPVSLADPLPGAGSAHDEAIDAERPAPEEASPSLASVSKAASMKAERAAIEQTLREVHWNRRKAAQILGVSYKTLLNKIKECGILRQ